MANSVSSKPVIHCVIPAAGVGKRMAANKPKQYLTINDQSILYHTVSRMMEVKAVEQLVIAISAEDEYFADCGLSTLMKKDNIDKVFGGVERVDSVLAGLKTFNCDNEHGWVLVHDAARPNVRVEDINLLIERCLQVGHGGILATPVRDTMKRGKTTISHTESREDLWHALTPQFFPLKPLIEALEQGLKRGLNLTDEASAMEQAGHRVLLVEGRADNIKITKPEDLALATFYLNQ